VTIVADMEWAEPSQIVGLRFVDLDIPRNARILSAHVEFAPSERVAPQAGSLTIQAQAVDDAPPIAGKAGRSAFRPLTTAAVSWSASDRVHAPAMGRGERTPDLARMLQEIVSRPGWAPGNAIVLVFTRTGDDEPFEGGQSVAPQLHVELEAEPPSRAVQSRNRARLS
jgi:hypothetical protein